MKTARQKCVIQAREKQQGSGSRQFRRREKGRATVKEVTYMVQRHQHHHRSAQHIDAPQARLILLRTEERRD